MEKKILINDEVNEPTIFSKVLRYRSFIIRAAVVLVLILLFCFLFEFQLKKEVASWHPAEIIKNVKCSTQSCPQLECPQSEAPACPAVICRPAQCPPLFFEKGDKVAKVEPDKNNKKKKITFEDFECFQFAQKHAGAITLLEDVMDSPRKPRPDSIFFLETSCRRDGLIHLTPRQMCSIESAALSNSNRDIFVLFVTPVGYAVNSSLESKFISIFSNYSNIFLRNMNLPKYVRDTPAEDFLSSGRLFESKFIQVHSSDFLRLLTVYKFGGTYFDLDYIIFKNLDSLQPNFFCTELENGRSGNSVVNFSKKGIGHTTAAIFLQEFIWRFYGLDWSANGPNLFRRIAEQTCNTTDWKQFTRSNCEAFEVHPFPYFYPIDGRFYWDRMYKSNWTEWVLDQCKNSYGVHTWNTRAKSEGWTKNEPNSVYSYWMKNYCPKMYAITGHDLFGTY